MLRKVIMFTLVLGVSLSICVVAGQRLTSIPSNKAKVKSISERPMKLLGPAFLMGKRESKFDVRLHKTHAKEIKKEPLLKKRKVRLPTKMASAPEDSGGPDGYGYQWINSDHPNGPASNWIEISGTGAILYLGDDDFTTVNLSFWFPFYDTVYGSIDIQSNGTITFHHDYFGFDNECFPTDADDGPWDLIAFYWGDQDPETHGAVYFQDFGTYAVIEFFEVPEYDGVGYNTYEVILYDNGNIEMNYLNVEEYSDETIGIQDKTAFATGNNWYLEYTCYGYPYTPHDSLTILFSPPTRNHDVGVVSIDAPGKLIDAGVAVTPVVTVKNFGQNPETFDATIRIDSSGVNVYSEAVTGISLDAGVSAQVSFAPDWSPSSTVGITYDVMVYTYLENDEFSGNDTLTSTATTIPPIQRFVTSPFTTIAPTLDGIINSVEWSDADTVDVSDFLGMDGTVQFPGSILMLIKHDPCFVYLAFDITTDVSMDDYDQIWLLLDDDNDGNWAADGSEGANIIMPNPFIRWASIPIMPGPFIPGETYPRTDRDDYYGISDASGHIQYEIKLPYWIESTPDPAWLGTYIGDTFGLFVGYYEEWTGELYAWWPQDVDTTFAGFLNPATYGKVLLEIPPQYTDVGVGKILSPPGVLQADTDVIPQVVVRNAGTDMQTFSIIFKILSSDDNEVYSDTREVTLGSRTTDTISFDSWRSTLGAYTTLAYIELAGDQCPMNDSLRGSFIVPEFCHKFEVSDEAYESDPPTGAWEWGIPTYGPDSAYSGSRCWATILDWDYEDDADWKLERNFIAISNNPIFVFYHWYIIESYYDGGNVKLSTDGGATWTIIHPEGGYPIDSVSLDNVGIPGEPAYSGASIGWELATFDLSAYVDSGDIFRLRWHFGSDDIANYPGWYIDDVCGVGFEPVIIEHDVGVTSIDNPGTTITPYTSINPQATVKNFGKHNETFPVYFVIDSLGTNVYTDSLIVATPLAPGEQRQLTFDVWKSGGEATVYDVTAYVVLADDEVPDNDTITIQTHVISFVHAFETSDEAYEPYPPTGAWEWGTPTWGPDSAHSGSRCWATILDEDYENDADWRLERNFRAISDNPTLAFYHWYDMESFFDGGNVKLSTDGGATWTIIHPEGGYPIDSVSLGNVGIPGEPAYSGETIGWELATFDLSSYVDSGDIFGLRWHFGSDGIVTDPGWYIDDISGVGFKPIFSHDVGIIAIDYPGDSIIAYTPINPQATVKNFGMNIETFAVCCVIDSLGTIVYGDTLPVVNLAPDMQKQNIFKSWTPDGEGVVYNIMVYSVLTGDQDPSNDTLTIQTTTVTGIEEFTPITLPKIYKLAQNWPNPFSSQTVIQYQVPEKTAISLRIYNVTGRLIRTLVDEEKMAGYYSICWDGKDENSREVSSGVYFYRLEADKFIFTRKMTIVK